MACNLLEYLLLHCLPAHSSPSSSLLSFAIMALYNYSMRLIMGLISICNFLGSSGKSTYQLFSLPTLPTVLTHFFFHKLHSVFSPLPLMSSKPFQVSQTPHDDCKLVGKYLLSSPLSWSSHPPLISYPRPTKCFIHVGGF